MPAPAYPHTPLSDADLTAKKPITQAMMRRLRDDGWCKIDDAAVTQETDTTKRLAPDGAGGTAWAAAAAGATSQDAYDAHTGTDADVSITIPGSGICTAHFAAVPGNGAAPNPGAVGVMKFINGALVLSQWTFYDSSGFADPHTSTGAPGSGTLCSITYSSGVMHVHADGSGTSATRASINAVTVH